MQNRAPENEINTKPGLNGQNRDNAIIQMRHVAKRYGTKNALVDINMDVQENELLLSQVRAVPVSPHC